jgi:2-keto-4-pentenoate hydratase/2-oxohepta-3-ene-1,7-dioic acid hydratase in catechol pathway
MKLVTFLDRNRAERIGAVTDDLDSIVDLAAAADALGRDPGSGFDTMLALIDGGPAALDLAREVFAAAPESALRDCAAMQLLSPVPEPRQMRDAMAFEKHVRQAISAIYRRHAAKSDDPEATLRRFEADGLMQPPPVWYEQPIYYKCNRFSVVGAGTDVIWPRYSELMDYELEFGIFIGKRGRDIPAERAASHIFGYVIFNDVSARDAQSDEMRGQLGPSKGKDFDTGNVIGPWLVTADEITDPYGLEMCARVNGEEVSRGNSRDMHHRFEDIIAWISRDETLYPGEFIGSGTVGDGCGLEHGRFLSPGDLMELEIQGLGVLSNRLVKPDR